MEILDQQDSLDQRQNMESNQTQTSASPPRTGKKQLYDRFYAISDDLNDLAKQDLTQVAQHLFTALVRSSAAESGCLFLMDEQGKPAYGLILSGGRLSEHREVAAASQHELASAEWVYRQRRGVLVTNTASDPLWASWTEHLEAGSALGLPLKVTDHSIGALVLIAHHPDHFDEHDLAHATHLVNQAATIIENTRLSALAAQQQNTINILHQAAHVVNSSQDLDQILYTLLDQLPLVIPCQDVAVLLYEDELLRIAATRGLADASAHAYPTFAQADAPLLFRTLRQRRTIVASDPEQLTALAPLIPSDPIRAWAIAPLVARGETLGLIVLTHHEPHAYDNQAVSNINAFANHVATAVATHHLARETDQRLRELAFLHETGQAITSTLNLERILQLLLERVRALLLVDAVSVALIDEQTGELVFEAASGEGAVGVLGVRLKPGQGIAGWVAETGKPLVVHDVLKDSRFFAEVDKQTGMTTQAILCVPIVLKGHVVGVIEALNPGQVPFDKQTMELLNALAGLAATAIDNARLFAEVHSAEARYEGLFEDSANPIIITDLKGVVLDVNRNACSLWGQSKEDLVGTRITRFYSAGGSQDFVAPHEQILANQEAVFQTDILSINQRITVEIRGRQVPVKGGTLIQWIGRDITAQIELEQTRDDMVHMIVHDLRNPLANIMNSLEVMHDVVTEKDTDVSQEELLRIAMRSGRRMHHLISSILDISRLESGQAMLSTEPTDLVALLQDAVQFASPQMSIRDIHLTVSIEPVLPQVQVDRDMISRVVLNLLENASKFTQLGGQVHLTAQTLGPNVEIAVADNGPGIPPLQQRKIFDKFVRLGTKEKARGTGLGLAFCKLAVKAHKGNIWVESTPGQGSTFRFTLPYKDTNPDDQKE
jgi:NtrC-family two-component system sensor histidine kinase KinB